MKAPLRRPVSPAGKRVPLDFFFRKKIITAVTSQNYDLHERHIYVRSPTYRIYWYARFGIYLKRDFAVCVCVCLFEKVTLGTFLQKVRKNPQKGVEHRALWTALSKKVRTCGSSKDSKKYPKSIFTTPSNSEKRSHKRRPRTAIVARRSHEKALCRWLPRSFAAKKGVDPIFGQWRSVCFAKDSLAPLVPFETSSKCAGVAGADHHGVDLSPKSAQIYIFKISTDLNLRVRFQLFDLDVEQVSTDKATGSRVVLEDTLCQWSKVPQTKGAPFSQRNCQRNSQRNCQRNSVRDRGRRSAARFLLCSRLEVLRLRPASRFGKIDTGTQQSTRQSLCASLRPRFRRLERSVRRRRRASKSMSAYDASSTVKMTCCSGTPPP